MARIFKTPFGAQGDTEQVPEAPQGDGSVSLTQGFGYDYEREYEDPAAKDIRREVMNGLFHDITEAIGDIQLSGIAKWDAAAAPYPAGAVVWHESEAWKSRVGNNSSEPSDGSGQWEELGDARLRQELGGDPEQGQGAAMVRGAVIYVDTIADLHALDTSALADGQQALVKDSGTYFWDLATASWLQSTPGNFEYVDSSGSNFELSLQSRKKTVLGDGPYHLSSPFTPAEGKQVLGTSHYSPTAITCDNGFIDYQGEDGTNIENLRIDGKGRGEVQNPLLDFSGGGSSRQNRISQVYLSDADVGVAIMGGWHYQVDGLELRGLETGIKMYPAEGAGFNWSGSGGVFSNIYVGSCTTGIDDTFFWGATYINPIFEWCNTPYIQSQSGSTSLLIAPWFENNTNPPQFRRDTVIIGGREVDYSDTGPFAGTGPAITELRHGISVFRDVNNPVFKATGTRILNLNTDLDNVGFSPERVYDDASDTYHTDGVRFSNAAGDENRSIFGWTSTPSDTPSDNSALSLEGYTTYWPTGEDLSIENHAPATRISLAAERNGSDGGTARGQIEFWTGNVTAQSQYAEKPQKRLTITRTSLLPGEDGSFALGSASLRYSEVFSATGAINTSDANLKTDIEDLDDIERSVANDLKKLIKKYKYKDSVEKKGDSARIHVGVIAQEVEDAFLSAGLDPSRYALFCRDVWYTFEDEIVEVNENGDYIELKGEDPESCEEIAHPAQKHERLGIRYDELLAFIISAM